MAGDTCDVCGRGPTIGVASSSLGPVSWAFCAECARKPAEPECAFDSTFYSVGGTTGEVNSAEWVDGLYTWKDGRYWSWSEWTTWRLEHPELNKIWDDYEAECAARADEPLEDPWPDFEVVAEPTPPA